jgi:glucose/arabinose dehydrogenase
VTEEGTISAPIHGLPAIFNEGQGGLLDVVLHPAFDQNKLIFFSYAEANGDKAGTAVARAKLDNQTLKNIEVIFRQQPKVKGSNHFGSRLVFSPDGYLFITLGERFDYMDEAQNPANHLGALIRIYPDGDIPEDNPFYSETGIAKEIWSYGHRNIQGAAIHPVSGKLWIHEHGPRGGDEINIPTAGKNYGWPEASYGIHYWMTPIKDDHVSQGFEEPIYHWSSSIAPSGMVFYTADRFPVWKGKLFIGALAGKHIAMLTLDDERVVKEEKLLTDLNYRIRNVRQGPDGFLYALVDAENGKILKISPQQ